MVLFRWRTDYIIFLRDLALRSIYFVPLHFRKCGKYYLINKFIKNATVRICHHSYPVAF